MSCSPFFTQKGCQCFASGCAYIENSQVFGCPSGCCGGQCPSQTVTPPNYGKFEQYSMVILVFLLFLVAVSTITLT